MTCPQLSKVFEQDTSNGNVERCRCAECEDVSREVEELIEQLRGVPAVDPRAARLAARIRTGPPPRRSWVWAAACALLLLSIPGVLLISRAPATPTIPAAQDEKAKDWIEKLNDPSEEVRKSALAKLLDLGEAARPDLEKAAKRNREAARALVELSLIGKPQEPPPFDRAQPKPIVEKKGFIRMDERWSKDKTYRITGHVRISSLLLIEEGTIVMFAGNFDMKIDEGGELNAQSVIFTSAEEAEGKPGTFWGNLRGKGTMNLKDVQVRYSSGIVVESAKSRLEGVGVYHTRGSAIEFAAADTKAIDLTVIKADDAGILTVSGSPEVDGIKVSGCRIGLKLAGRAYEKVRIPFSTLTDVTIEDCDKGIESSHDYNGTVSRVTIRRVGIGIHFLEGGGLALRKFAVSGCREHGIVLTGGTGGFIATIHDGRIECVRGAALHLQKTGRHIELKDVTFRYANRGSLLNEDSPIGTIQPPIEEK